MTDQVAEFLGAEIESREDIVVNEQVEACRWLTVDEGWLATARGPARFNFVGVLDSVYEEPTPPHPGEDSGIWVLSLGTGQMASFVSDDGVQVGLIVQGLDGQSLDLLDLAANLATS